MAAVAAFAVLLLIGACVVRSWTAERAATRQELVKVFPEFAAFGGAFDGAGRADDDRFWWLRLRQTEAEQAQSIEHLLRAGWTPAGQKDVFAQSFGPPKFRGRGRNELRIRRAGAFVVYGVLIDSQMNDSPTWRHFESATTRPASDR